MKNWIALLLLSPFCAFAQPELDSSLTRTAVNCDDVLYNASVMIPVYDKAGDLESCWAVMDQWGMHCAASHHYAYTLAILQMKSFGKITMEHDPFFFDKLIDAPVDYRFARRQSYTYYSDDALLSTPGHKQLFEYLYGQALQLYATCDPVSIEAFTCLILTGRRDEALDLLRKEPLRSSGYSMRLNDRRKEIFEQNTNHWSVRGGMWNGSGNAAKLGAMSSLGFSVGGTFLNGDIMDATLDFWIGSAPADTIQITFMDSIVATDYVSGMYAGLEYDKQLWRSPNFRHRIGVRVGVGYSHINLVPERYRSTSDNDNDNDDDDQVRYRKYAGSFAVVGGLAYSYHLTPGSAISAFGRYYYTDYRNGGGTPISGPAWTLGVSFDFFLGNNNSRESRKVGMGM